MWGVKQILFIIAVVALVGCGGDPNKKANELFVEAVQLIDSAEEQTGEAAIKDYESKQKNIRDSTIATATDNYTTAMANIGEAKGSKSKSGTT